MDPAIKALFLSGYSGEVLGMKRIMEKDLDFISKPVIPDQLLNKIRTILDK
jgi:hypothetical protein